MVHNLLGLVILPKLCRFCCFSMWFFMFIELLETIVCFLFISVENSADIDDVDSFSNEDSLMALTLFQ